MGNSQAKQEKNKDYTLQTCEEHEGSINCMEISEDGSVLVTGSDDSYVRLWSTKTELIECIGVLEGHEDYITSLLIEDNFVLSSSADKTMRKWDMYSCECLIVFTGHASTVNRMVCTGDFLFSVSYDKKARCWDFDTGECIRVFTGHKNNVTSVLFIPADHDDVEDAMRFVADHASKKGRDLKSATQQKPRDEQFTEEDEIYNKDLIITGSLDSYAKAWSIETGECFQTYKGHTAAVTCLATDPFGKLLFTGSADHSIRSWEIMTGQMIKVFQGHQTTVISLLAHRKLLYSTASDHTARCWVMEFGDCTRTYKEHTHSVSSIIEDGGLVYTACGDGNGRCFDAKSGALKRTFKGHTGAINCLKMIGERLFTGSFDATLKVWDASELFPEQATEKQKKKQTAEVDDDMYEASQKLSIENEKAFRSQNSEEDLNNNYDADYNEHDREQYREQEMV